MLTLTRAQRTPLIAVGVVVFHALLLWAFQQGLIHRAFEVIVATDLIAEFTQPEPLKPPPAPKTEPKPLPVPQPKASKAPAALLPSPVPVAAPMPAEPVSTAAPTANSPVVAAPAGPAVTSTPAVLAVPTAPAKVELPSSDAQYLQNPKPGYPALSKRMGEQGKVVVHVLIGVDGLPQKAEIKQSSGFERLDKAALNTVLSWKYVPGKRGGVPEAMWFNVPINFVLE
jgi:protein TonB